MTQATNMQTTISDTIGGTMQTTISDTIGGTEPVFGN